MPSHLLPLHFPLFGEFHHYLWQYFSVNYPVNKLFLLIVYIFPCNCILLLLTSPCPWHSYAFYPLCLLSLQNSSDFIVLLNWGVNLLVRFLIKPSVVLIFSFSACVKDSMNCRPFLPHQFLLLQNALCEVCYMKQIYYLLLTWSF